LFLLSDRSAELLDDLVHVGDLTLNLWDDLSLGLLKEHSIHKSPALASIVEGLHGVHDELMLLLFLFNFEDL
jgi:hypothetical protein